MRTMALRLAAGSIAAGVLLSGCGGSPEPKPLPKPRESTSPSTSATPASPKPPVMPAAAKAKSKDGAEAFIEHYVQLINYAGANGKTAALRELSLRTCVKCEALADGIDKVYAGGGRIIGGGWTVDRVQPYGFARDHYFLDAVIDSAPQQMVAKTGAPAQRFPGAENRLRAFVLERGSEGWKVSELDPSA